MASRDDNLLGRVVLKLGLVSPDELAAAQAACQATSGASLDQVLLERGSLTPAEREKLLLVYKTVVAKTRPQTPDEPPRATRPAPPAPRVTNPAAAPAAAPAAKPETTTRPPARQTAASTPATAQDDLPAILRAAVAAGASDVHLHAATPLRFRIRGELTAQGSEPLAPERSEKLVAQALDAEGRESLAAHGETDFSYVLPGVGRFRGNAFRQLRGVDAVLRHIPDRVPTLADLRLPESLARFTEFHQGMVLVTGPAGCGKSTTLAAFLDLVNQKRRDHILTVEDPIEFVHVSKGCLVNQRNAGRHTQSFARALRAALREDPDVISIGELRDLETISLAITAAETGHLVLATLHTESAIRTVDRLIGAFPPNQQEQVRAMLAESLRAVISQRLCRSADGTRMLPALEVLVVTRPVGKLIRDQKTFQLPSVMQTGAAQGMRLLDESLFELVRSGAITRDEALRHCADPKRFEGVAS